MPGGTRLGSMYWEIGADRTGLDNALAQSEQAVQRFGQNASGSFNALTVAAGNLLANGISAVAGGLKNLVGDAFNVTAEYERMTLSMESLAKRDLMNAGETEKTIVTGQKFVEGKAAELDKIAALQIAYDGYAISLDKARYHLAEISKTQGPGDIDFRKYANDVANYEQKLADTKKKMDDLGGESGKFVDVTKKVTEQHLSNAQATLRSRDAAQELLTWVHKLAVESPFDEEGARNALQTAMTYGFITDQAKALELEIGKIDEKQAASIVTAQRLTQAAVDYVAGAGRSPAVIDDINRALGQMSSLGKVTAQDMNQLTSAGVDGMSYIAKAMGISKAEAIELRAKGLLPADKAILAIVQGLEKDFGGAAKRQTETWSGLISTLGETKKLGMRVFFESTFKALKPLTVGIVNTIADPKFIEGLKATGELLGKKVEWGVEHVRGLLDLPGVISQLAALPDGFKNMAELDAIFGKMPEDMRNLAYAGRDLVKAFQDDGMSGVFDVVKGWAGEAWGTIRDWWDDNGEQWVTDTVGKVKTWIGKIPDKLLDLAMGAGAWLAGVWTSMQNWWDTSGEAWAKGIAEKIGAWFGKIGDFLKSDKVPQWVNDAMYWLEDAWLGISNWWTANVQPLTDSLVAGIDSWMNTSLIPALQNTDKTTWTAGVGASIMEAFEGIGAWLELNSDAMAYTIGDFLGRVIVKGAELLVQAALLPATLVWEAIEQVFMGGKKGEESTNDIAKWLIDGLVNGIQSAIDSSEFWKKLKAAIDSFVGKVKDALGIKSPSTVFADIGTSLVDGLIKGIEDAKDRLLTFVFNWARSVIPKSLWAFFGIDDGSTAASSNSGKVNESGRRVEAEATQRAMAGGGTRALAGGGMPAIYVNVYAGGGGPEVVRRAANEGTMEALRARGYR